MPNNQADNSSYVPTILVKKTDGTSVRMTLSQFSAYQRSLKPNESAPVEKTVPVATPLPEPVKEELIVPVEKPVEKNEDQKIKRSEDQAVYNLPAVNSEHKLATTSPVKNIFIDEAAFQSKKNEHNFISHDWQASDHESLLTEDVGEVARHPGVSALPATNFGLANGLIEKLSFSVDEDLGNRLYSLLISWIKGVRNQDQVREYAQRDKQSGGFGLDAQQVEELIKALPQLADLSVKKTEEQNKPISIQQNINNTNESFGLQNEKNNLSVISSIRHQNNLPAKNIMHDVQAPVRRIEEPKPEEKVSVGPIEQLQQFSLLDLRRLASDEEKASEILWNKFQVIRQDSYIWFSKALRAWQESPIMNDYEQVLTEAINKKIGLNSLLGQDKTKMNQNEFLAIASLNKKLGG